MSPSTSIIGHERRTSRGLGRNFALLWFGEGISLLGNSTTALLIPVLAAVRLHAGPGWMGALAAAAWLPWLLVGLPAGAWVDRLPPRRVMIVADLCSAAALLVIPIVSALGWLDLAQLLVVTFAGGVCTVFFRAAYAKLLPLVVGAGDLEAANARMFGTESAAQVVGPGLAGLITHVMSAAAGLCADAVSFLVSAWTLSRVRLTAPAAAAAATAPAAAARVDRDPPRPGLGQEIRHGLSLVGHDRNLRTITVLGGLSNFGLTGYAALLVLYFVHVVGISPAVVGVVFMLGSVGGLLGATVATPLARSLGTGRASTVLFLVAGPSALLIGLPTRRGEIAVSVLGLALVGAAVIGGNVIRGAWRQRYVPAHLMGRVLTTMQFVNYGTMPAAGLTAGWMGGHVGIRATVLIMAGVHAATCVAAAFTRFGRSRVLPAADRP